MTTGERIRFYRKQKGMTLKELGEKAGLLNCGDVRMAQYQSGAKIAEALDVPVDALCCTASECMKCKSFRLEQLQEYRRAGKEERI